jgi:ubiquinone/menaquinone biosynthesis C-methylase UbiE
LIGRKAAVSLRCANQMAPRHRGAPFDGPGRVKQELVVSPWIVTTAWSLFVILAATGFFFFATTRGALLVRALGGSTHPAAHVYPIYSDMRLIRLVDFQPVISAILLFQYRRLVSMIVQGLRHTDLSGGKLLITSCAFGNVMPRVAKAALKSGAREVQVVDLIENELIHAQRKLQDLGGKLSFDRQDAAALTLPDASVDANVVFFLLHELPHALKGQVLAEACRVLTPGGKLYLAEFHRPSSRVLRALSWTYFKVFEPLGLALWDTHDPRVQLEAIPGMRCERRSVFFGNFQVIVATKAA